MTRTAQMDSLGISPDPKGRPEGVGYEGCGTVAGTTPTPEGTGTQVTGGDGLPKDIRRRRRLMSEGVRHRRERNTRNTYR